jgi:hypothetical protein
VVALTSGVCVGVVALCAVGMIAVTSGKEQSGLLTLGTVGSRDSTKKANTYRNSGHQGRGPESSISRRASQSMPKVYSGSPTHSTVEFNNLLKMVII